jgi:hypothetical protein
MTDTLYFSADEVMKGIRLLFNELDGRMFREQFFPEPQHTDEYVMGWFELFRRSPFKFWCSLDDTKRKKLNFLIDEATSKELHRERARTQTQLLKTLNKAVNL